MCCRCLTFLLRYRPKSCRPDPQQSIAVIPTDTVYGIVARAADEAAVARLYALKPRENQPGTLIASSVNDLAALGLSLATLQRIEHYWPASLSVIIDAAAVPEYLKKHAPVSCAFLRTPTSVLCSLRLAHS